MSKQTKGLLGLLAILALIAGFVIPIYQEREEEKRLEKLYQHGFRLLEEQIATYIVEHYSSVSKVEFSPIFKRGGDGQSFLVLDVVPVIYDTKNNKAYLGKEIGKQGYGSYGTADGLNLDFDIEGKQIVEIKDIDNQKVHDVSEHQTLPDFAKLSSHATLDENIAALVEDGQLENVKKSSEGSPKASISYNTEVREGDYTKWP